MVFILYNKIVKIYEKKNNQFKKVLFLEFYHKRLLKYSIELLKKQGFLEYKKYYLYFINDYVSPIFEQSNTKIGYAYLYDPKISDYSKYIINNELEAIIKLYFNYAKIRLNNTKLRDGKYILINPEFINEYKKYYNYAVIEQKLNSFPFVQKILSNMKTENRDYNKIIDDKKICIIIKQFLPDINQQFISMTKNNKSLKINNINEEPKIENVKGTKYYYYNNFEIIDETIYELLIKNDNYAEGGYYRDCFFENNYMYFNVHGYFCEDKMPRNIEICSFNQNTNSFSAKVLFELHYAQSFESFMQTAKLSGGFEKCIKSYEKNNLVEEILNNNGQVIGLNYNLLYNAKNTNINKVNNNNKIIKIIQILILIC